MQDFLLAVKAFGENNFYAEPCGEEMAAFPKTEPKTGSIKSTHQVKVYKVLRRRCHDKRGAPGGTPGALSFPNFFGHAKKLGPVRAGQDGKACLKLICHLLASSFALCGRHAGSARKTKREQDGKNLLSLCYNKRKGKKMRCSC